MDNNLKKQLLDFFRDKPYGLISDYLKSFPKTAVNNIPGNTVDEKTS